jgi:1-acyl-sn-glycerol-3-phosphate acyltransferase
MNNSLVKNIIFPLRVFSFFFTGFVLSIYAIYFDKTKIQEVCNILLDIAGLKKRSRLEITDKNSIVIFNHINMFDALIMYSLFKNPPAIVARQEYITNFPLKLFNRCLTIIPVSREGKQNTTVKINEFIEDSEQNLLLAPDGCNIIRQGDEIAEFKNGAFINDKRQIIPIVIRYKSREKDTKLNWNNNNILELFLSILKNGDIDVFLEKLGPFTKEKTEETDEYKTRVWKAMCGKLSQLPSQYPKIC